MVSVEQIREDFQHLRDLEIIELDEVEFMERFWNDIPYWHVSLIEGDTEEAAMFVYLPEETELGILYNLQPYIYKVRYAPMLTEQKSIGGAKKIQELLAGYTGTVIVVRKIKPFGEEAVFTIYVTNKTREVTEEELFERAWDR